jgi:hypothetical protein
MVVGKYSIKRDLQRICKLPNMEAVDSLPDIRTCNRRDRTATEIGEKEVTSDL